MTEIVNTLRDQAAIATDFNHSMELAPTGGIVVINPDEYTMLAQLSDQDARHLPDGLYVIDETVRQRLEQNGFKYDALNSAVFRGAVGEAGKEEYRMLQLGRESSAHQVIFGSIRLRSGREEPAPSQDVLIAIKRHVESQLGDEGSSAKPFRELGNLALLHGISGGRTYKPLGIMKDGDEKYVLSEFMPGINTLDDHRWYGKRFKHAAESGLSREQRQALRELDNQAYERDVALIGEVLSMFGMLHAQGIFHGDAQIKNIGWTMRGFESEDVLPGTSSELENVEVTLVDLENSLIFGREDGDFSDEYYQGLFTKAGKDVRDFVASIPGWSKMPKGKAGEQADIREAFLNSRIIEPYIDSFVKQRKLMFGENSLTSKISEDLRAMLRNRLGVEIYKLKPEQTKAAVSS